MIETSSVIKKKLKQEGIDHEGKRYGHDSRQVVYRLVEEQLPIPLHARSPPTH